MAKVTLILEDTVEPDGKPGLMIDYDATGDYEVGSLAHEYAAAFVQHIVGAAKKAVVMDKEPGLTAAADPNDPNFN